MHLKYLAVFPIHIWSLFCYLKFNVLSDEISSKSFIVITKQQKCFEVRCCKNFIQVLFMFENGFALKCKKMQAMLRVMDRKSIEGTHALNEKFMSWKILSTCIEI